MMPSHPILSCGEAKAWEAALLADEAAEWAAMQQAGAAIAAALFDDFCEIGGLPADARLLVLAGKGHNGGDALLAAARILASHPDARVEVVAVFPDEQWRPLAARSWQHLLQAAPGRVSRVERRQLLERSYDVCVDGVFGFHFRTPISEAAGELIALVNTHPRIRLRAAVDLPSGVGETENADTIFRADFTYATGIVKQPVFATVDAPWVGRLRYLDLGFFAGPTSPPATPSRVLLPAPLLAPLARLRPAQSDKRTHGHLLVVGGSRQYPGAVLMTVQAALRSGVGLLTAFVPASLVPEYAARFPEAMWVGCPESEAGGLTPALAALVSAKAARASALVIGPGLGATPETIAAIQPVVRNTNIPLLLDADALRPEVLAAAAGRRMICTPHAGELARLGGRAGLRPPGSSLPSGETVVVFKGSPTRLERYSVDSPREPSYVALTGGPVLARGGSGDLLAGLIGGLLAQQPQDLLLAAARGTVWHGLAADLLARDKGQIAVQTTQLLDFLQPALRLADHVNSRP